MVNRAIELIDQIIYGPEDNEGYWRGLDKDVEEVFENGTEEERKYFEDNWDALETLHMIIQGYDMEAHQNMAENKEK